MTGQAAAPSDGSAVGGQITLRASTNAWVEVGTATGEPVLSRVMRSGETFEVPARTGMMLSTGNAGGIEVLLDGETLPPLGPLSAVRRNIALDTASLRKTLRRIQ